MVSAHQLCLAWTTCGFHSNRSSADRKVRDVVKDYRGLLHAHWTLNNTGRKAKRKGERQAERRKVRRQLVQYDEPTPNCSVGGLSDDGESPWMPDNPPNDGHMVQLLAVNMSWRG